MWFLFDPVPRRRPVDPKSQSQMLRLRAMATTAGSPSALRSTMAADQRIGFQGLGRTCRCPRPRVRSSLNSSIGGHASACAGQPVVEIAGEDQAVSYLPVSVDGMMLVASLNMLVGRGDNQSAGRLT